MPFSVGDRVRIANDYAVSSMLGLEGIVRHVRQVGPIVFYHVEMDNGAGVVTLFPDALELVDATVENPPSPNEVMQPLPVALPAEVAGNIRSMTFLMSGVPWTPRLMEELHESIAMDHVWHFHFHLIGYTKVTVMLARVEKGPKKNKTYELEAAVKAFNGVFDVPQHRFEHGKVVRRERFPDGPAGVKSAVEFLQEGVQFAKQKGGFCETCANREPPEKRFRRNNGSSQCGKCLVSSGFQ